MSKYRRFDVTISKEFLTLSLKDITECANDLAVNGVVATDEGAAMYGIAQSIPDRKVVGELATTYIEAMLDTNKVSNTMKA